MNRWHLLVLICLLLAPTGAWADRKNGQRHGQAFQTQRSYWDDSGYGRAYPQGSQSGKEWRKESKAREKAYRKDWKEREKDRREAAREWDKDRREALREWRKDRAEAARDARNRYRR